MPPRRASLCWCPRSFAVAPASGVCFPGRISRVVWRSWRPITLPSPPRPRGCGGRRRAHRLVDDPAAECRRAEGREGVPQVAREVACPMADCRPGQVLGQLPCLGEGDGVAGASPVCLVAVYRRPACRPAGVVPSLGGRAPPRPDCGAVEVEGRGSLWFMGRSGPWGHSDRDGTVIQKPRWLSARESVGWQRCNRERAEPDRALPSAELSGDLVWRVAGAASGLGRADPTR
jgi:hypothetical protein